MIGLGLNGGRCDDPRREAWKIVCKRFGISIDLQLNELADAIEKTDMSWWKLRETMVILAKLVRFGDEKLDSLAYDSHHIADWELNGLYYQIDQPLFELRTEGTEEL